MTQPLYTHKGLFGLCPVYMTDPEANDGPAIEARHWIFEPLFDFSEWMFWAINRVLERLDADYQPVFPLIVTGALKRARGG